MNDFQIQDPATINNYLVTNDQHKDNEIDQNISIDSNFKAYTGLLAHALKNPNSKVEDKQ